MIKVNGQDVVFRKFPNGKLKLLKIVLMYWNEINTQYHLKVNVDG